MLIPNLLKWAKENVPEESYTVSKNYANEHFFQMFLLITFFRDIFLNPVKKF
jgi:hypothetical protein